MDGYMDTMDALHSYGSREKAGNLKRFSHCAFCRDYDCFYVLIAAGVFEIKITQLWHHFAVLFLSRIFSVQLQLSHFLCKKEGTLHMFCRCGTGK